jgi:hypothetical protein
MTNQETFKNDWYCIKRFPIPFGKQVILRGIYHGQIMPDDTYENDHLIEAKEWSPLDGLEPKTNKELHDATN